MKTFLHPSLLALCASSSLAPAALVSNYTVVYDNGISVAAATNGRTNDPDYPIYIEHADNFRLTSTSSIQGVLWAGTYEGTSARPDEFSLRIYTLVSGKPDLSPLYNIPLVALERWDTGLNNAFNQRKYSYQALFPEISLDAGTYAMSIYNQAADGLEWFWAERDSPAVDGSFMFLSVWGEWRQISGGPEFSFSLIAVPEPGLSAMAFGSILILSCSRRRNTDGRQKLSPPEKRTVEQNAASVGDKPAN